MKRKKDKNILTFRSGDLNPRFSVIFPPMIWIFMWSEEDEIKSQQASKRDRTLKKLMKRPNRKRYRSIDIWALAPMICTEKVGDKTKMIKRSSSWILYLVMVVCRHKGYIKPRTATAYSSCSWFSQALMDIFTYSYVMITFWLSNLLVGFIPFQLFIFYKRNFFYITYLR